MTSSTKNFVAETLQTKGYKGYPDPALQIKSDLEPLKQPDFFLSENFNSNIFDFGSGFDIFEKPMIQAY